MKSCGSCKFFIKWPDGGLCEAKDARTFSDYGRNCKEFKRKKYERSKKNLMKDGEND